MSQLDQASPMAPRFAISRTSDRVSILGDPRMADAAHLWRTLQQAMHATPAAPWT